MKETSRTCRICHKEFIPTDEKQTACESCSAKLKARMKAYYNKTLKARRAEKRANKDPHVLVCAKCGKEFTTTQGNRKYCDECKATYMRDYIREYSKTDKARAKENERRRNRYANDPEFREHIKNLQKASKERKEQNK